MAARPSVPCSMYGPTLENRPPVLVDVLRTGICTAIVDHPSTHISARSGPLQGTPDSLRVSGMNYLVLVAVKQYRGDRVLANSHGLAADEFFQQVALPHRAEGRYQILGGAIGQSRMHADGGI